MPHKANPVLSVLVRRAALTAPQLAATLHLAAAEAVDERPTAPGTPSGPRCGRCCGATVVAGAQTTELLDGLRVHAGPDGRDPGRGAGRRPRRAAQPWPALAGHRAARRLLGRRDVHRGRAGARGRAVAARPRP